MLRRIAEAFAFAIGSIRERTTATGRLIFLFRPHTRCQSLILLPSLLLAACAFDVVRIEQVPTTLATTQVATSSFTLRTSTIVNLPSGYSRTLKAATVWQPVGSLSQGGVFKTGDQVLTIEGSNIYEAYIVVRGARLVGFYLPANGTYSPLSHPIDLNLLTPDGKTTVLTGES